MKDKEVLNIINKIFKSVFSRSNDFTLDEIKERFAFDIKLPKEVYDSKSGEVTYADSINSGKFITLANMEEEDSKNGWMQEKQDIKSIDELLAFWDKINYTTTERVYDSINVSKSDTIYGCENVYNSTDMSNSKNIIFCDSCGGSEYLLCCSRSGACNFCIRTDDSKNCLNSYNVICSNKIINSFFIQDCFDLYECMFCSHIASKKFCIANMQFEEEEYMEIKKLIIEFILTK